MCPLSLSKLYFYVYSWIIIFPHYKIIVKFLWLKGFIGTARQPDSYHKQLSSAISQLENHRRWSWFAWLRSYGIIPCTIICGMIYWDWANLIIGLSLRSGCLLWLENKEKDDHHYPFIDYIICAYFLPTF